ncbi:histidine phosphatase family protein [Nocardioides sp. Kera G14]|uniref:histidine phosphatase family protein n=1 Tax=Nocardioides sp. Kera G14 TaxID=2884264 RepID=UPI001D102B77|nr:histidine phosphatase family protein [Nocardioides sp. Kera G14]UDY23887.1 histidine phosphatase family protein [Nocardioides sp. Kera G14]
MTTPDTIVHLLRHGEVYNPDGILYGRRDGFHLSERGRAMAEHVAGAIKDRDITHMVSSPLERAQETAAPLAAARGLEVQIDERVIESANDFEGMVFKGPNNALKNPRIWPKLWNPARPSWGEPFKEITTRMLEAIGDARAAAEGHEAVIVSHQLPIWTVRLFVEGRSYIHNPRNRQCTLCSLTSFHFVGEEFQQVSYSEPVLNMIPVEQRDDPFSAGGQRP